MQSNIHSSQNQPNPRCHVTQEELDAEALFLAKMSPEDRCLFENHGNNRFEPIFIDRVFYIYQCQGRGNNGKQRAPNVQAVVRVINMALSLDRGLEISLLNETTNQKQIVRNQPSRLFDFPIFIWVPCSVGVKTKLITRQNGEKHLESSFGVYVKAANKAAFYSNKNFYAETPKGMRELYPEHDWTSDLNG